MTIDTTKGFTLIEILIAISILVLIIAVGIGSLANFHKKQYFSGVVSEVVSVVSEARSNTLGSLDDTVYGVHFQENKIVSFKGGAYSSSDPDNQELVFQSGVTVTDISVTGGDDVLFKRLTGDTDNSGTITFSLDTTDVVIVIESTGAIYIQ